MHANYHTTTHCIVLVYSLHVMSLRYCCVIFATIDFSTTNVRENICFFTIFFQYYVLPCTATKYLKFDIIPFRYDSIVFFVILELLIYEQFTNNIGKQSVLLIKKLFSNSKIYVTIWGYFGFRCNKRTDSLLGISEQTKFQVVPLPFGLNM